MPHHSLKYASLYSIWNTISFPYRFMHHNMLLYIMPHYILILVSASTLQNRLNSSRHGFNEESCCRPTSCRFLSSTICCFCYVHCMNMLWEDARSGSDLATIQAIKGSKMKFLLHSGSVLMCFKLCEMTHILVGASKDLSSLPQCVGMWWCSSRAYLAVRQLISAKKIFKTPSQHHRIVYSFGQNGVMLFLSCHRPGVICLLKKSFNEFWWTLQRSIWTHQITYNIYHPLYIVL